MALLLPLLNEYSDEHQLLSSLWGGGNQLSLKISDDDFLGPLLPKKIRRHAVAGPFHTHRSLRRNSNNAAENKHFTINIDVQQFSPEDISAKCVNGDTIIVEGKHEEQPDEHGSIFRHFVRKYKVPKGHDATKCVSKLSSDGVLTVAVPLVEKSKTEVEIPITVTNQPSELHHGPGKSVKKAQKKETGGKGK